MNKALRLLALTLCAVAAACSSPVAASDRRAGPDTHRLDTAAADSGTARGGGNLMGGN